MRTQDLIYYLHLCESKSFTATAEEMDVSQPTVSQALKRLEEEFKTSFFLRKRGNNIMKLTESGELFRHQAQKILDIVMESKELIAQSENQEVKLGVPPIIGATLLPIFLPELVKFSENINIIEKDGSRTIYQLLRKGEVDMALVGFSKPFVADNSLLKAGLIVQDSFDIFVSANHPLAEKKEITLSDLSDQTFVSLGTGYVQNKVFLKWAKKNGIEDSNIFYTNEVATAKSFVKANVGAMMLVDMATSANDGLVKLQIKDVTMPDFYIYLLARQSATGCLQDKVYQKIADIAKKEFPQKLYHD
ncbi:MULTISPECIES: LysR family transcriptional regulator [Aerococcus]|uniref:LysR family transcriptional regulator n=1 Tax=Aerococcus tenax TaxID=3078812 RepID=A0A5N1BJ12_9LACT|nr:LysR family transcriptional regulator [Aerococcus urinae]KAA9238139.1 LysR family transcriptional regulator [Aerococcus urinae]MDK7801494.1 LysR family transcriptional regulator [Aerococcus urinae]MDK8654966.1 LysR family transcriptional regulator [Aerococcus urinae]RAV70761.1 hypothetical protein DBT40_06060 [Aerococcus urinae]RAW04612.1 hypothetical protein DBT41_06070 [Aerococcus urinae]